MEGPGPEVRLAKEKDYEAAAEALTLAFVDDPAWAHLLPDDDTRAERLLVFFTAEIASLVPDYREVWITEDGGGAAIWGRPGRWRVPLSRTLGSTRQMAQVFGSRLHLAIWALWRAERHHPRQQHWYLNYLGVEPRCQGRGMGTALMAPILELCDREDTPAYLESSSERSRLLYERNAFALTGSFDLPVNGPPMREMWREPRSASSQGKGTE